MPTPYLGVDLGGTNIKCALVQSGKVLGRYGTKTKPEDGPEGVLKRIAKAVDKTLDAASVKKKDVAGLGIGAPGAVDFKAGVVLKAVNLGWDNYPLAKALGEATGLPVAVDNDVNVGAWGEYKAGAGRKHDDLFAIFVGTGIGGGFVLNGELYHGPRLTAGEVGHTLLSADAGLGRRTVEDLASRNNIARMIVHLIESGHPSVITELVDGDYTKVRSKVLAEALARKDPLTVEVVKRAAFHVGVTCANVVTLLSLPCVVVGGGATEAMGKTWMHWVRGAFLQHVFPEEMRECEVVASTLGDDAGTVGAALLAEARLG